MSACEDERDGVPEETDGIDMASLVEVMEKRANEYNAREKRAPLIAVVGPTGVGKSTCAEFLARRLGCAVLSADSMQVYRHMDIGTAKMPPAQRQVPYFGLDLVDPGEEYSAACYQAYARAVIERAMSACEPIIICGGTGLYVRAAIDEFEFAPGHAQDNPLRLRYGKIAEEQGAEALHRLLEQRDPQSAALIHPHNVRRTIRALELNENGESYAHATSGFDVYRARYPLVAFGMRMPRAKLYERIDQRVDEMVEDGLVEEVHNLVGLGFRHALTSMQAIGYKELLPVLDGEAKLEDALEDIKRSTRRYAKRQLSWFGRDPRITWFHCKM